MIPNNSVSTLGNSTVRAQIPPDTYKNNILKAKTCEENKIAPTVSTSPASPNDRLQRFVTFWKIQIGEYWFSWGIFFTMSHITSNAILYCFFFHFSTNLNLTGDSPPPKEVPDMSSATFVSVVSSKNDCLFLNYNLTNVHVAWLGFVWIVFVCVSRTICPICHFFPNQKLLGRWQADSVTGKQSPRV